MKSVKPRRFHKNAHVIFDVLYGFVPLTEWENQIVNSPFYQRLRWIKQLGFSNYIFPGAEHNRFAHAIGVMHSMEQMIRALDIGVSEKELFDPKSRSKTAMIHKSLRVAALLHDIGTFPFSHAIEYAYIRHGNDVRRPAKRQKELPNTHEHLGSFIIKNTDYKNGITQILEKFGIDVQLVSKIIKGNSPYLYANQLMHSDLDADRMDYLIRDAHYTGLKYGQFDREYILSNLVTYDAGKGQTGFGVRKNAIHAVEDFLIARFAWYSQVIRPPDSAKFDVMSTKIAEGFLKQDAIYQFHDLLEMVEKGDERFYWWNDNYFITRCQELHYNKEIKDPHVADLTRMLLYRNAPKSVKHPIAANRLIQSKDATRERKRLMNKIDRLVKDFETCFKKHGTGKEWILVDAPEKDVIFTTEYSKIATYKSKKEIYRTRDPLKIVDSQGNPSLLVELDHSLMKYLSGLMNFVPSIYANDAAMKLLKKEKLITQ